MGIRLLVGLGNPGRQYEQTRHNAGFWLVDGLAQKYGAQWLEESRFVGSVAAVTVGAERLLLLKPNTFMNRSGQSVGNLLRYYKFALGEVLVVHDELDLNVGIVRLKQNGGHAGHNGVRDIIEHAGGKDFYRLRVGIGRPPVGRNVADYVLASPAVAEKSEIISACEKVIEDIELLVAGQFDILMNRLH